MAKLDHNSLTLPAVLKLLPDNLYAAQLYHKWTYFFYNKCEHHHRQKQTWCTHIAAVESQLEEVGRTVSNHVLEHVVVQAEVLVRRTRRQQDGETQRREYTNV